MKLKKLYLIGYNTALIHNENSPYPLNTHRVSVCVWVPLIDTRIYFRTHCDAYIIEGLP